MNCLSRLWWAGRITYDASNPRDPFELADLITERAFASTILLLSSNNFISNPALALGLLDAVKQERDNGVEIRRKHFVGPAKYLNRMGGITILDYLSREQVRATWRKAVICVPRQNVAQPVLCSFRARRGGVPVVLAASCRPPP